ncbi:hypothetical protein LBMAG47_11390 [Planctomycetia bacterium]|jgi:hypothetical protein|nr:hypothetical protein LBMAG47_11390 [Planctomycetia bacterium]
MQDAIVIAVAVGAAVWLVRMTVRRLRAPGCGGPTTGQPGAPAFVPLDRLVMTGTRPPGQTARRSAP